MATDTAIEQRCRSVCRQLNSFRQRRSKEAVALVREQIGPVAAFKTAIVARLPKTRSGKILRGTMRKIADGEDYAMPATIDDPAILDEIAEALARRDLTGSRTEPAKARSQGAQTKGYAR